MRIRAVGDPTRVTMINEMKSESQDRPDAVVRPLLTSYDSGYEHSLEHWIEVQHLVNERRAGSCRSRLRHTAALGVG